MPDKGKQLYDALSANPKYKNLGKDYESFKKYFSDPGNAAKLYSALSKDPKYKNVGKDVDGFTEYFGLKKKRRIQVYWQNFASRFREWCFAFKDWLRSFPKFPIRYE